jgi:HAD superfamily hydrolase (TIGR01509 family)
VASLVIFDCDGVLVDSDRISLRVQAERLRALGLDVSYDDCVRDFLGLGMPETLRIVEDRLGHPVPVGWEEMLGVAVQRAFIRELTAVPGVTAALGEITAPVCVASNGSHAKMRLTLALTGLQQRFAGRMFSRDDVGGRGKPAPDLFLHAAQALGVPPAACVVVEDSPVGVAAARSAGMRALGYAGETPPERLAGADVVFTDMSELPQLLGA